MLSHRSLIAGVDAAPSPTTFEGLNPATGALRTPAFHAATPDQVAAAATAAWAAYLTRPAAGARAALLDEIAAGIDRLGEALISTACEETGLSAPRITSERDRTTFSLRMFADIVREGSWVEAAIDAGDLSRKPLPKPDLRRMLVPIGPVAVFGASNFPLAYSVAGGDTASALAAGCPVVVKGHSMHPATGELVARSVTDAVRSAGLHHGYFSFLHAGGDRDIRVGTELVSHPAIRAVGFTGSVAGGTALTRLGAERTNPIPVFAEMGSVNPVFVLPGAITASSADIALKLAASATASVGQMCTCPGLIFITESSGADSFIAALAEAISKVPSQTLLGPRTRTSFFSRLREIAATRGVSRLTGDATAPTSATAPTAATLFVTDYTTFRGSPTLHEECFGPETIVVRCRSNDDLLEAAARMHGSLTGSVFAAETDHSIAGALAAALTERVGRLVWNGVPTGVEVAAAMVHGGPFPACSRPDSTAVGRYAMHRWCRPLCFQNAPNSLLPEELRDENPRNIVRRMNGTLVTSKV